MTPEQQRIAIAEACGWRLRGIELWDNAPFPPQKLLEPPDYLNDLNAMHEAEGAVILADSALAEEYGMRLGKSFHPRWFLEVTGSHLTAMCHITAAQRAEAFLRTIGKWTTNPNEEP